MTHFDVFNGDADGICSLLQLRLATPIDSLLITGAKRDIALLQRVDAQPGDGVTALDISAPARRQHPREAALPADRQIQVSPVVREAGGRKRRRAEQGFRVV
jgi:hypothetical protein